MITLDYIICYSFFIFISFASINYIIKTLFFIHPMCKKYKIMVPDLSNDIRGRYPYILISFLPICLSILFAYIINKYFFILILLSYIIDIYFLISKYQKFNLLNYINEFSSDLFDWEKIYDLCIDENIKKNCFQIHNINYDKFELHYLEKLKYKQSIIEKSRKL